MGSPAEELLARAERMRRGASARREAAIVPEGIEGRLAKLEAQYADLLREHRGPSSDSEAVRRGIAGLKAWRANLNQQPRAVMPSAEDQATLQAHWTGADEAARRAEQKWGIGRLPRLVDSELRAKFERQRVRLSTAYEAAWASTMLTRDQLEAVTNAAAAMQRAWSALDTAATQAGEQPLEPVVWETATDDGRVIAVCPTVADASRIGQVDRQSPSPRYRWVYTLAEVAQAVKLLEEGSGGIVDDAKLAWPGATVTVRKRQSLNDEIPF